MICHWMVRIERIIEKLHVIAVFMEMPKFPCVKIEISNKSIDLIMVFIKNRVDEHWLILSLDSAQHQNQLWTAWLFAHRSFKHGKALARSIDAEFLRYLAGTHHISEAFNKVGFTSGDQRAWLVYLPPYELIQDEYYPKYDHKMFDNEVSRLSKLIGFKIIDSDVAFSENGLVKLGIDVSKSENEILNILISNIISTDLIS